MNRPGGTPPRIARTMLSVAVAVLALAGCGTQPQTPDADSEPESRATSTAAKPAPKDTRKPVSAAGGLCKLLSYQVVESSTGVQFDHAASAKGACALQVLGHEYPDLTLAASDTKIKAKKFQETFAPDGADKVDGLGDAGYQVTGKAKGKAGPTAEVGWLAGKKFYLLHYTFEKGATKGQAEAMADRLVTLAKQLKTS